MYVRIGDGSIETATGKTVYCSVDRFVSEIVRGNACFICGASPAEKQFNDEHVIPQWILKKHELYSGRLTLPNSADLMYGRYVIPCCVDCNALMASSLEDPISEAFSGGYDEVCQFMKSGGAPLLFIWLASLFLKTHLKHRELRWHLDARLSDTKIAELYDWNEIHHIHCIVRSLYSGARLAPGVYGSMAVLPASLVEGPEYFDYGDLLPGRSVLLRLGDAAVVAVLNDSGAVLGSMKHTFERLEGPLTKLQLRELMVRMGYCNILLDPRPRYLSAIDPDSEVYVINAEVPREFSLVDEPYPGFFGNLFYFAVGPILEALPEKVDAKTLEHVKEGRFTFLFDDQGKFMSSSRGLP